MKLKRVVCRDLERVENIDIDIKSESNLLLIKPDINNWVHSETYIINMVKALRGFFDNNQSSTTEDDVGIFSIIFENNDRELIGYSKTVDFYSRTPLESYYRNNNLIYYIDHLCPDNRYINPDLTTKPQQSLFSAMCCYPNLGFTENSLIELGKTIFLELEGTGMKSCYTIDSVSDEAKKIASEIILASGLGFKSIDSNFMSVTVGSGSSSYKLSRCDLGTGAETLLKYLPGIINTILSGGICIFYVDICSRFHPLLLKFLLNTINKLAKQYNSQVIFLWYGNEDYLIDTNVITKQNIVSPLKTTESLILE